jgi:hypothetical protein
MGRKQISFRARRGEDIGANQRWNVIAFPLERSRKRALGQQVLHLKDGKFISAPAPDASIASLQEWLGRIEDRALRLKGAH